MFTQLKLAVTKTHLLNHICIIALTGLLLASCSTVAPELPLAGELEPGLETTAALSLRGDPNFSEAQLPTDVRMWYKRLWKATVRSNTSTTALAQSGDLFKYGRDLNEYLTSLLLAFRATGDLRLLDEVDRYTQMMRGKLDDKWSNGATDGYLNWQYLKGNSSSQYYGNDTQILNEQMTHSLVAAFTYAFAANRDLQSPGGVDYKERTNFWANYLINHFEAKWRKRTNTVSSFPFIKARTTHAFAQWMRYHNYMYKLTGKQGYKTELERMGQVVLKEYKEVNTSAGVALVFDHVVVSENPDLHGYGLQPTIYAKYQSQVATDLYFEGVTPFGYSFMQKFARTFSRLILDGDPKNTGRPMAIDVGGTVDLYTSNQVKTDDGSVIGANLKWLKSKGFNRWSNSQYGYWPIAGMAAFDSSNKIKTATEKIYSVIERNPEDPRWVSIPAGIVIALANK